MTSIEKLRSALRLILDQVDYTNHACRVNEMVGAVLPENVIKQARQALLETRDVK